ncbi:putative F-box domain, leucine-rich repeat domain superfamily, F-box-like domain superfamily [Helianthus annuus]|nr:putative F-box domain, leucine-rich repeat domain superfamily, F-box-like domain superfamily [Helianthus annuus]
MGDRKRVNVEGDRLSSLPDDLIHKILSFVRTKHAVQTSVLSSRWRYIWTSIPCLNFSCKGFRTFPKFSKFVKHVLSGRNNQIEVSSVELTSRGKVVQPCDERILSYAFSHNVQEVNITFLPEKKIEFPVSLFSSQSLKNLTLTGCTWRVYNLSITTPPTWELQTLATLNLHFVTLHDANTDNGDSLFSHCANLKNLTLKHCRLVGLSGFNISHPGLSSLTLEDSYDGVNVVTPQLKNLIIKGWRGLHLISAPNLSSLHYKGSYDSLQLSTDLLHLERVDVCLSDPSNKTLLSLSVELISHQPSPFANLKSLKVYPNNVNLEAEKQTQPEVTMSTEVKNYLLDSSPAPGATFTIVSHEEVRTARNVTSARNLMSELQGFLDEWKENRETNTAHMKQDKAPIEIENRRAQLKTKRKWPFGERMTHIKDQFWEGHKNTFHVISKLEKIEEILTRQPTSRQAKLQQSFSNLCLEAVTIMDNILDHLKIQCDKKPRLYLSELDTASQPSS